MQKLTLLYVSYFVFKHGNALMSNILPFYFLENFKQGVELIPLDRLIPVWGENKFECLTILNRQSIFN